MSFTNNSELAKLLENNSDLLQTLQCVLLQQLKPFGAGYLVNSYPEARKSIEDLISRVITNCESNSILLTGPRGCGKSALVDDILTCVKKKHSDDVLVARLNGILHTDDKSAIKDIARQLTLENVLGDKVHGSVEECLSLLLSSLYLGDSKNKAIIIVIDEFDLFCEHKNQTLLYNLFDVAQSRAAPMVVIGLTARLDALEMLEKRVKSRFSHRVIHLSRKIIMEDYIDIAQRLLSLPAGFKPSLAVKLWSDYVKNFLALPVVSRILRSILESDCNIRTLKLALNHLVRRLQSGLSAQHLEDFWKSRCEDSRISYLKGLSILELCIITAMLHLSDIYDGEPVNFEMIYKEYAKFAREKGGQIQLFDKPIVMKAFEHLMEIQLIEFVQTTVTVQPRYRLARLHLLPNQLVAALDGSKLPTDLKRWVSVSLNVQL